MAERSVGNTFALCKQLATQRSMTVLWRSRATGGIIPPFETCKAVCDAHTSEMICPSSSTIAIPVSSQDVSIPNINVRAKELCCLIIV